MPIGTRVKSRANLRSMIASGDSSDDVWRVKAGETARVRFLTEPSEWSKYNEHWDASAKQPVACIGRNEGCVYCEDGARLSSKFLANVYDLNAKRVRALSMTKTVAESLLKRWSDDDTIMDCSYEISREGSGLEDTKYDVQRGSRKRFDVSAHEPLDLELVLESFSEPPESDSKSSSSKKRRRDDDDDDDDDEPTWATRKSQERSMRKAGMLGDDDEDDDDEEEDRPRKRVSAKKAAPKKAMKKVAKKPLKRMR